jgi:cardiolipin synthase
MRSLKRAAERGVDVKILLPKKSDNSLVYRASHSCFDELLQHGVRIFEYEGAFLHAKTILVDNSWSLIGSFNFDSLSFFYNHEAAIVTSDEVYCKVLQSHCAEDLTHCTELTLEKWRKRPFLWKWREFFIRPFKRIL